MTTTKKVKFLFDMVTAHIKTYRTIALESKTGEIKDGINNAHENAQPNIQEEARIMAPILAEVFVMTDRLEFEWPEDAPDEYRALEVMWDMYKNAEPIDTVYEFWRENIPAFILIHWQNAITAGQKIWKPVEQKAPKDTEDPN